jgi:hypothetical protein
MMSFRLIAAAMLLPAALPLYSQLMTGSIVGTVQDPSQAGVPDARVTLVQTNTGRERVARTDASGVFVFAGLDPAPYQLTVAKEGFIGQCINNAIMVQETDSCAQTEG